MPASSSKKTIQRTNRFGRDIRRMPHIVQEAAFEIAKTLAIDIFDPSVNVKAMTGIRGVYRAVIVRVYRLVFSFDQDNLYLLRIGHRREIYRDLEL